MKQFNIYAGLGGSFGGMTYQYTGMFEDPEEAEMEAYEAACEQYEQYEDTHGLRGWDDATEEYCRDNDITEDELTDEDTDSISDYYTEYLEEWVEYKAVPTEEDDIDAEDLILDYIIEDDSSSQADSE